MSHVRHVWLLFAVAAAVLLPAALAQQAAQPARPAEPAKTPPAPAPKADPDAVKSLDLALERYGPRRIGWVKTTLWQQVDVQGLTYQAEGTYLSGPDYRLRLDLKVRLGGTAGETVQVCDGKTVWTAMEVGGERNVVKYSLKQVLDALNAPGVPPEMREQFLQEQAFVSVVPLLHNLKQQVVFTRQEKAQWQGREALLLTGVWNADVTKVIGPNERLPAWMPRTCKMYLDAKVHWPLRIEWWGPAPPQGEDVLLLQIEFRDPLILAADAKPPAGLEQQFTFNEGGALVTDQTKPLTEKLRAQAKQFASQKKAAPSPPP